MLSVGRDLDNIIILNVYLGGMSIIKPNDKEEAKRSLVVLAVVLIAVIIIAGLAIGMATSGGSSDDRVKIVVSYSGSWSGAYGDAGSIQSWSHDGPYTKVLERPDRGTWIVSANAQKEDSGSGTLTISIQTMDGKAIKTSSTATAYGVAQVAAVIE